MRKGVPEYAGCVYERLRVPVYSWVRELDRIGMRMCCKSSTAWSQRWRHREFRKAVSIVIAIEERERESGSYS